MPKKRKDSISNLWLKTSVAFGLLWIIVNVLFVLFDTSPVMVISFISTVMAFYVTYFLPIYMTIKVGDYKGEINDSEGSDHADSLLVPDYEAK